jgi:hypothetical protein
MPLRQHAVVDGDGDQLDFEALFVSGGAGSPQQGSFHSGSSPAGSPSRSAPAFESPPASPPRAPAHPLTRVSSVGMDIPAVEAEEQSRVQLVGPSPVPAPATDAAGADVIPSPRGLHDDADDGSGGGDELGGRKLGPSDFTILSLVGQGAFGKVRATVARGRRACRRSPLDRPAFVLRRFALFGVTGVPSAETGRRARAGDESDAKGARR